MTYLHKKHVNVLSTSSNEFRQFLLQHYVAANLRSGAATSIKQLQFDIRANMKLILLWFQATNDQSIHERFGVFTVTLCGHFIPTSKIKSKIKSIIAFVLVEIDETFASHMTRLLEKPGVVEKVR